MCFSLLTSLNYLHFLISPNGHFLLTFTRCVFLYLLCQMDISLLTLAECAMLCLLSPTVHFHAYFHKLCRFFNYFHVMRISLLTFTKCVFLCLISPCRHFMFTFTKCSYPSLLSLSLHFFT